MLYKQGSLRLTIFAEIGDFDTSGICGSGGELEVFISSSGALCMSTSGNSCMHSLVFSKLHHLRCGHYKIFYCIYL